MSGAHAKFSPSGAHRWMECVGSAVLESEFPNESSIYADEGTAAHFLGSTCLTNGKDAAEYLGKEIVVWEHEASDSSGTDWMEPRFADNPEVDTSVFTVDDAFAAGVQVYLDDVRDRAKGRELWIEQKLQISKVLGIADQFGTGDALVADVEKRHLTVEDLKFGRGEQVYPENNHQMMLYALGALETLDLIYGSDAFDFVTMVVCQPRIDWVAEHTIGIEELRVFGAKAKSRANVVESLKRDYTPATLAKNWDAYLSPGDKTCRWCKAKAVCPALAARVSEEAFNDFPAIIDDGAALAMGVPAQSAASDEIIGRRFAAVDLVMQWASAVQAEAERRVFAGAQIINPADGLPMKIVEGKRGDRAWTDPKVAEALLTGMVADKAYKPREVVTVAQAQAVLGVKNSKVEAKKPENNPKWQPLLPYIKRAAGKPSVALGSDPRPVMNPTAPEGTEDDFAPVDPLLQ